jgi:multiple sugar transport system permease protein
MNRLLKVFEMILVFLCVAPFFYLFGCSFFRTDGTFSLQAYYDVFFGTSRYLIRFWKSLLICGLIVAGQLLVSILAGYGFAKYDFPGKTILFFLLMVFMILPLQVTLVPNYIMLDKLHLLGKNAALILPGIFVPLGTFIITHGFGAIPDELIDAAKLDGCGTMRILTNIAVPINKGGVVCAGLLSFLDAWNMVEQPIAYLNDFKKYPISVALAYVSDTDYTRQLVCCMLVILPPLFLFSFYHEELVEGIAIGEVK